MIATAIKNIMSGIYHIFQTLFSTSSRVELGLCLLLCSCNNVDLDGFFPYEPSTKVAISRTHLSLDTIKITPESSSYVVESSISNENNILVIDRYLCNIFTFDTSGIFLKKSLGQGRGPNETSVGRIATHTFFPSGDMMLLGYNLDHHIYDSQTKIKTSFTLSPMDKKGALEDSPFTYTHLYNDMVTRSYNDGVYFSVRAEHPDLNYLNHTDKFLKSSCNILEVDIESNKAGRMLAKGYPQIYHDNPNKYVVFSGINFDIDALGNFYVSYEADSLIYMYDKKFNPIRCFGAKGRDMDCDYEVILDFEQSRKHYRGERNTKGYYYWVEYENQTNTLFRTYKKGELTTSDGLQIYRDGALIADVDIPKNMRVMGYIAPYYYSYVIGDQDAESMVVYRFRL